MLFRDRIEAGRQLAQALHEYKNAPGTLIIALPRGGVVVGYEISKMLNLPLDIVCPRKIGAPFNPEFAIGAITETGDAIFTQDVQEMEISDAYIQSAMEKEKKQAQWRLTHYRQGRPPRLLKDLCIILTDDGLATGSTMHAAIKTVRSENAKKIVLAIPVAPEDTLAQLEKEVDQVVCLSTPSPFYSVGQFYEIFDQTTDEEVCRLLALRFEAFYTSRSRIS